MRRLARWLFRVVVAWRLFGPIVTPRWPPPQSHPWRVRGMTVFAGDREFMVRQIGPLDGRNLVLVHGLGGASLAEWYKMGPALAERYRVTVVDHRSHGLSPRSIDRFEIEDVADDIAAVLGQVDVHQAAVVGYSMGGTIAQALAHRHPHLVDRVVLVGTFSQHPGWWRPTRVVAVWIIRAWERVTGLGSPEVRALYLLATRAVDREHARWLWEETHRRDSEAGTAASFALLRFDSSDWIGRIRQPALVVIPLSDQLVPPRWQYDLAAALPDAQVLEIPGARHEAPFTHPQELVDAIFEFMND